MLRYTLVSCVFMCFHSWIRPSILHLLSAVRRTEAFWKLCTTWKCFLLHHMFPVHSDSHTLNLGHCIAVCMQELIYRLLAITASILTQVLVWLLLQAYAPLTMFWCNNATHLSLLRAAPSCTILLGQHLLYKDVEYIIV